VGRPWKGAAILPAPLDTRNPANVAAGVAKSYTAVAANSCGAKINVTSTTSSSISGTSASATRSAADAHAATVTGA
jgi:hypothetical protein